MLDVDHYCDICGGAHRSVHAKMSHNVGMLIMRRQEWTEGRMCRSCLVRTYLRHTGLNLVLGWWGMISFVLTIVFLVGNTVHLVTGLFAIGSVQAKDSKAQGEREAERERTNAPEALGRFRHTIRMRLKRGESVEDIAEDMVDAANVPFSKAHAFVSELSAAPSDAK